MPTAENQAGWDQATQLASIERSIAETRKFGEESSKLNAERRKLDEEVLKMNAEALKLQRDRSLAPLVLLSSLLSAIVGGIAGTVAAHFLH